MSSHESTLPAYLFDVDVIHELVQRPHGKLAEHLATLPLRSRFCTSILVVSYLRSTAQAIKAENYAKQLDQVLAALEILPFAAPAEQHYVALAPYLCRLHTLQHFLVAQAMALEMPFVTLNKKASEELLAIPDLLFADWSSLV